MADPHAAQAAVTSSGRPILTQLAGMRAAASTWIVLGHFMEFPRVPFGTLIGRGVVPTGVFILLSGFVTHYAYHGKPYETSTQVLRYYARRFGAILFSYYATWLLMVLASLVTCARGDCWVPGAEWGPLPAAKMAIESLFFVQAFEPIWPYFPNGPAWTISTMGLMWLLYPKLQAWLRAPLARRPFALATGAALVCQLPSLCGFFAGCVSPALGRPFFTSKEVGLWHYHFPPLRLPDFVLGMALAQALADGRGGQQSRAWAWVADGSVLAVWAACWLIPQDSRTQQGAAFPDRSGYEPLFVAGMQPLIGLFVFASSCAGGAGSAAGRVLRHPVLRGLGEYSFQVYLWHWPLGLLFERMEQRAIGHWPSGLSASYLMPYLLASWTLAAVVSTHAEEPFRLWLRSRIDAWAARREGEEAARKAAGHAERREAHAPGCGKNNGSAARGEGADGVQLLAADMERSDGAPAFAAPP